MRQRGHTTPLPHGAGTHVPVLLGHASALVERQPVWLRWTTALVLTAVIAWADLVTGPELAFSIFYLVPVTLAAWHLGWRAALLMVALSGVAWFAADIAAGRVYQYEAVRYWNTGVRTGFFYIVAYTLTRLREGLEHERDLARTDALTGVANGRSFRELAERELSRGRRSRTPVTIAYIDVDGFKWVNDTLGHAIGDELLCDIADALSSAVRDIDVVARVGGDEFALLLPGCAADEAPIALERVTDRLTSVVRTLHPGIGFSIGVVTALAPRESLDELMGAADARMYQAKRSGGSRVVFGVADGRAPAAGIASAPTR